MKQNRILNTAKIIFITNCMLFSLTGCGNAAAQSPVPVKESTGNIDTVPGETSASATSADYLTLAEAKSIVLEMQSLRRKMCILCGHSWIQHRKLPVMIWNFSAKLPLITIP